jgi:large subunit ribosomal protein L24
MSVSKPMKLRKNDTVQVIKGKDRGKSARILRVDHATNRVIVEGLNIVKKAVKARKQNEKGGIKEIEASIAAANVMIVCKKCGPTRIGHTIKDGVKTRTCRKCGDQI